MATPFTVYKLIVLYMLNNAEDSLSNSQISEFILDREYTNYFHLQQAVSELVESDLIEMQTVSNTSYYHLTEDGKNTLTYFEKELSPVIRREVKDYLKKTGREIHERILTPADYYATDQGSYTVRCQIIEKNQSMMDFSMSVPSQEAAKAICRHWPSKSQVIYEKIMEELL